MDEPNAQPPNESQIPESEGGAAAGSADVALSPLHKRILDVFFSPGRLTRQLAAKPAWGAALAVVLFLVALQTGLIPVEVMQEAQREAMLERGQEAPEMPEGMMQVMRIVTPIFGAIGVALFAFLLSGIYTLIFAFVLGDEGKYKQYLSVLSHAWIISVFVGLLITPLRISAGDPQMTVSLGSFAFFLSDGSYLLGVLKMIDLSQTWAALVIAQGAHAIDPKRSFLSASFVTVGLQIVVAMIFAVWIR